MPRSLFAFVCLAFFAATVLAAEAALDTRLGVAEALTNCDVADLSTDGEEQAFLGLINNYRAQSGLAALTMSTNLGRSATWMAVDMGVKAYFSHTDSLGRGFAQRMTDCGATVATSGENIAAGYTTAQDVFTAWKNSPGHNANMLTGAYKQIGISRAYTGGSPYGWYWVTDFSSAVDGTGGGPPAPASGSISASPNPCRITSGTMCSTTISWSTQNVSAALVTVTNSLGGGEVSMAGALSANAPINWIGSAGQYTFRLYNTSSGSRTLLASTTVTGVISNPSGTISASPNPCTITSGMACSTVVSWSTQNVAVAEVTVANNLGGGEVSMAGALSANYPINWIGPSGQYTFRLYDRSSGSRVLLGSVSVTGQLRNPTGTISASPSPCKVTLGTTCATTVSWSTQNVAAAEVTVAYSGTLGEFSMAGALSANYPISWISLGGFYTFRLYDKSSGSRVLLGSVNVSATR